MITSTVPIEALNVDIDQVLVCDPDPMKCDEPATWRVRVTCPTCQTDTYVVCNTHAEIARIAAVKYQHLIIHPPVCGLNPQAHVALTPL